MPSPRAVVEATTASGQPIYIRQHGNPEGPRLVLSHGNGFASDALYPLWSHFLRQFEVVVFDLRHHGWNPPPKGDAHHIPAFLDDWVRVAECIRQRLGDKPAVGVFHSLASVLAVLDQVRRPDNQDYSGLMLFELPLWLRDRDGWDLGRRVRAMSARTRRRKDHYGTREELADELRAMTHCQGLAEGVHDLIAATTTRPAEKPTDGYVVCCPRQYEARLYEDGWVYGTLAELQAIRIPVKVLGGDPTCKYSFLPSLRLDGVAAVDYDYVPGTSHLLPLEEPETCAGATLEFLESRRLKALVR